ncbi:MAG: ferrichrome ABC transporter permease [Leifsonia xyli]|nr:MAG: ferrichrome ABC transporter permease [Leifsonia xyli]
MSGLASRAPSRLRVVAALAAALALFAAAILFGVVDAPPAAVVAALFGHGGGDVALVVGEFRIPRVVTGVLAGAQFAVAGALMQTVTRNPLADPSLLGVSQGATLAVALFLLMTVYGFHADPHALYAIPVGWLPFVGCLGGLLAGVAIYLLAIDRDVGPLRITLCGVAIGAMLHAAAMGLIAGWGSSRLEVVLQWLAGSLYARSWEHVRFLAPFTAVGLAATAPLIRSVDVLRFEERSARSFGLAYRRDLSLVLGVACVLAASAAGAVGPLMFVGLVTPHLARALVGGDAARLLPASALLGAMLVTVGDLAGRLIGGTEEIPIGVVTAIAGAPVMVLLLRRANGAAP